MRPARGRILMDTASLWAKRSTCSRNAVGAVIAIDGRIIATGYNGAPAGMSHCSHVCNCRPQRAPFSQEEADKWTTDPHEPTCASLIPCTLAVHAEANAIAFAASHGLATAGADLYTTLAPCYVCSQLIINAGIRRVIYLKEYRDKSGLQLLDQAKVILVQEW